MLKNGVDYSASWEQICDRALGRLGADGVDNENSAEYCERYLPEAVEHVLGQFDFTFARKRERLAPDTEPPAFGWKYRFNLPVSLIRLTGVYGGHPGNGTDADFNETRRVPYQAENGAILANTGELFIIYTERPDDPNRLTQGARKAISTYLAYLLSTAIASNEQLTGLLLQEAAQAIETAKKEDAQTGYDPAFEGEPFHTEARK
ncbi:MAG: hypothetical protein LBG27_00450 [Spirochaetaceae bacterium]|jgi:hypothetical protein|nr:hypothetical protein [Spirochaetaceae bacterium]